ncbi:uncharacterized protein LOC122504617 [Leptopilina heterotoma]|uniref:uncharacterized protein LOC122504617 n=1 Tax=Leptopilina heterotoma TaxID=63436 RepID=UPI001CA9DC7E|nr:uncharacterized protein LOC122504617 [Leptopilina heterotoma]
MSLDPSSIIKTLGLRWDPTTDEFLYVVNLDNFNEIPTKRSVLSKCAKLYDPLGLLGPVIVIGKLFIQELWKLNLDWDTVLPVDLQKSWLEYLKQLPSLNDLRFNRCITVEGFTEVQVHGFCDASEKAYGACLYLRSTDRKGEIHVSLVCSKSRVAPIKSTSLPRLELCSAHLLAELCENTIHCLKIPISKMYLWSDSMIALSWINTPSHLLETFLANRVAKIQHLTKIENWKHVPTESNPADILSRGVSPSEFVHNSMWSHGPSWLNLNENEWPEKAIPLNETSGLRKPKPIFSFKLTQDEINILTKYNSWQKTIRIVAYCLRFVSNSKIKDVGLRRKTNLSLAELNAAKDKIIRLIQKEVFSNEIHALENNQSISKNSSLISLNPFLDQGIIKVGGRLVLADIPENQKHPIVLPKNHHVTKLIIKNEHLNRLHAGVNATLCGVRESYWPIDGRNTTRHIVRQCTTCFRAKPRDIQYLMGNLPKNRLTFSCPFLNVGVDFCGPFYIKEHRHRNRTKLKTYVAVFVCFATKAVHLELASDLSTEAFLACLKRFFARKGLSQSIHSDNATNFVGTNNEIKELFKTIHETITDEKIGNYLSNKTVSWHFIPPRAPHFGGLWEAAVKSFKFHFVRIAGNSLLTYEQLNTYVTEIESILNSRPLTPLSPDPNDLNPLTPGHFLIGGSLTSLPEEDFRNTSDNRLSCWQLAQKMGHHFWDRWYKEYLNELMSRSKWQAAPDQTTIKPGTLILVKENNQPPMKWPLGRISEIHPGSDGIVRTVTIKTGEGIYKRALKNVCLLPMDKNDMNINQ